MDKTYQKLVQIFLTEIGLKCLNVKLVTKKSMEGNHGKIIYVVHLGRKSTTSKELRQNYNSINRLKDRWNIRNIKGRVFRNGILKGLEA